MSAVEQGGLSPVKQALFEIRRLKEELARERQARSEPIAVVGVGLRFPGAANLDEFWDLLRAGRNAVGPIPASRWDHRQFFDPSRERADSYYVQHGGFLSDVEGFDPEFFGIAPLEAEMMDPQQRLILETAWEALEHAGVPAGELGGSRTGVFVGIATADYHRLIMADAERVDAYASSGTAGSVAAGRISYLLGLQGPAISVDTACSSSLVAVHLATNSLRAGESDLALAAGVNLMLAPETTVDFCSAGMLSPDGKCRTFDAEANGYVRSEGCGVVVLKRLRDAERDGDRILALIRGTAVNQDGRSSGLTAPNGPAQEAVIATALEAAGVKPDEVDYVEAHGTGTSLGDPIEAQALGAVYGPARPAETPLYVGSAKTNLGHLEAAAGIAGFIKAVEVVRRREIPPHLHFSRPNPHIRWSDYPLVVPTGAQPLPHDRVARAGVSSFGFSGTNAHLILESPPQREAAPVQGDRRAELIVLSAPQEAALRGVAAGMLEHLGRAGDDFAGICATAASGRTHFAERLVVVARDAVEARSHLSKWLEGSDVPEVRRGRAGSPPKVGFRFSGAGGDSTWLDRWPVAQAALQEARASAEAAAVEASPAASQAVAAAAHEHAVATLLRAWGVEPLAVVGGGAGRYLAAHHAGLITLGEALNLIVLHARSAAGEVDADALRGALGWLNPTAGKGITFFDGAEGRAISAQDLRSAWAKAGSAELAGGAEGMEAGRAAGVTLLLGVGAGEDGSSSHVDSTGGEEEGALIALAEYYLRGGTPRWKVFTGARPPVTLPSYPFQRRPFWFKRRASAPAGGPAPSSWEAAVAEASARAAVAPVDAPISRYGEVWVALEELTERVGQNTLIELGAFTSGEERTLEGVLAAAGIGELYTAIVKRWLDAMVRRGSLRRGASGYIPGRVEPLDTVAAWERVRDLLTTDRPLLRYLEHTVPLVPGVLGGSVSPLETLFPDGSFEMAADLYENSSVLRYVNGIAASSLAAFIRARPADRPIRVLEVGAGTGGTTGSLLPILPADRSTYLYTDVSEIFLEFGATKFASAGIVQTKLFDLERDPAEQGLVPGSFDVVVGSNVIHAARDVRDALRRVHSLLAPGGMLLLVESTGHHAWHDISTGLIEGWQHFADDLRAETPLLPPEVWRRLLAETGFEAAVTLPGEESVAAVLKQHIVLGAAGAGTAAVAPTPETPAATSAAEQGQDAAVGEIPGHAADAVAVSASVRGGTAAGAARVRLSDAAAAFRERLSAAIGPEREEMATAAVRDCVMEVLRADPTRPPSRDARLMDLGLDSLMAVRLRNQLQKSLGLPRKLPATLVFDYPSIRQIAMLVIEVIQGDGAVKAEAENDAGSGRVEEVRAAEVAAMSEAEIEAMLDQLHTEGLE